MILYGQDLWRFWVLFPTFISAGVLSFRAQPFVLHQQAGELRIEGEQVRESSSRPAKFLLWRRRKDQGDAERYKIWAPFLAGRVISGAPLGFSACSVFFHTWSVNGLPFFSLFLSLFHAVLKLEMTFLNLLSRQPSSCWRQLRSQHDGCKFRIPGDTPKRKNKSI